MDSRDYAAREALKHLPTYAVENYLSSGPFTSTAPAGTMTHVAEKGRYERAGGIDKGDEIIDKRPPSSKEFGVFASVANDRDWSLLRNSDNLEVFLKRAKVQSPDLYNLVLKNQMEFLDLVWRKK